MKILHPIVTVVLLGACSNQQLYTAVQENQRLECGKLPQDAYEQCMDEVDGSYNDYEKERTELIKEKKK